MLLEQEDYNETQLGISTRISLWQLCLPCFQFIFMWLSKASRALYHVHPQDHHLQPRFDTASLNESHLPGCVDTTPFPSYSCGEFLVPETPSAKKHTTQGILKALHSLYLLEIIIFCKLMYKVSASLCQACVFSE